MESDEQTAPLGSNDRRSKRQRESDDPVARYLGAVQAELMSIFWRRGDATVREVVDEVNQQRPLAYTGVMTMITRLWSRGLLSREPEGRGYRYTPAKSRDELLAELSNELIDRLLVDFGEIAVTQLGSRLGTLGPEQQRKLRRSRKTS